MPDISAILAFIAAAAIAAIVPGQTVSVVVASALLMAGGVWLALQRRE